MLKCGCYAIAVPNIPLILYDVKSLVIYIRVNEFHNRLCYVLSKLLHTFSSID